MAPFLRHGVRTPHTDVGLDEANARLTLARRVLEGLQNNVPPDAELAMKLLLLQDALSNMPRANGRTGDEERSAALRSRIEFIQRLLSELS
jgi:hypothetical protein